MNCSICGGENSAGARFCKHCGASVSETIAVEPTTDAIACPSCGKRNKPGAKFCTSCSANLAGEIVPPPPPVADQTVACPKCGSGNKAGALFCAACGHGLTKDSFPPEVQSPLASSSAEKKVEAPASPAPLPVPDVPVVPETHGYESVLDMAGDDEIQADSEAPQAKSKRLVWMLVAIAVGAVAAGSYVYFDGKANAPTPTPAQVTAPPAVPAPVESPVPAAQPSVPNSQPTPPQPVSPASAVVTPGPKIDAPKSATAKPEGVKTTQTAAKPVSREKPTPAPSASNTAPTTKPDAQPVPPVKSKAEVPAVSSGKSTYEQELEACRKKGFFERGICTEQVKWKSCTVNGVWDNTKPGCER